MASKYSIHWRRTALFLAKMFEFRLVVVLVVILFRVNALSSPSSRNLKVLLMRHGQSDANVAGVMQGSGYPSRLTPSGQEQARQAAMGVLDGTQIDAVYCSPLGRALKTWELVKETLGGDIMDAVILNDLREIDLYDWEGLDKTNLANLFPDSYRAWKEAIPDELVVFESRTHSSECITHYPLLELWERADSVWDDILEREASFNTQNKCILIVAHGVLGQALLGSALGWDATYFREYTFQNCGIAEVEWNLGSSEQQQRPLASRWRWKWPKTKNQGWRTLETAQSAKAQGLREEVTTSG